jgi:flagellar basal-body rod modification protein FlgD
MDIAALTSAASNQSTTNAAASTAANGKDAVSDLGMDQFLKLLTTQLANQDPLEPMKDTDFIAQMASITSLEQMTKFTNVLEGSLKDQYAVASQAFLGKDVTINNTTGAEVSGRVDAVEKSGDDVKITVNGVAYDIKDVLRVELPTTNQ